MRGKGLKFTLKISCGRDHPTQIRTITHNKIHRVVFGCLNGRHQKLKVQVFIIHYRRIIGQFTECQGCGWFRIGQAMALRQIQ